jgi:hypothetical protein
MARPHLERWSPASLLVPELYLLVGDAVRSGYRSLARQLLEVIVERGDECSHRDVALWQTRSRELMRHPERFEYEAWCGGGLARQLEAESRARRLHSSACVARDTTARSCTQERAPESSNGSENAGFFLDTAIPSNAGGTTVNVRELLITTSLESLTVHALSFRTRRSCGCFADGRRSTTSATEASPLRIAFSGPW